MHYTLPSILALASLAAAAPTPEQKNDPWEGVIDPWGQYGRKPEDVKRAVIEQFEDSTTNSTNFRIAGTEYSTDEIFDLAKRASIDSFAGKIPGCDDDPSKVGTPKPQWAVNEGVRIPKNGNDDACTTGHNADHCWTTYFLVEAAVEYYSWLPTGSAINCPPKGEGDCSIAVTSMAQSCSITGTTSTDGYDHKIIDASAKLGIGFGTGAKNSVDLAGGMGISHNWATTDHKLTNICRADSSTATCHWGGRRSGTVPPGLCAGDGKVQQNSGDGSVCVRGQKEFDIKLPINKMVQCNGKCGSNEPGIDQPANEARAKYIAPNNWDLLVIGRE